LAAAAIIQGVQIIQTREMDVLKEPTLIMFGKILGGTAANIIPDSVLLSGTLRFLFEGSDESPNNPKRRLERVVSHICAANRVDYEFKYLFGNPPLVNHPEMTNFIRNVASAITPPLTIASFSTLVGEDFSEFSARTPGVFFFVGAGKTNENNFPHHHSRFDFDEAAMQIGTELMVRGALQFFEFSNEFSFISSGGVKFSV
jgi:metal-dependent amidase/aminoacylase/carboxypeptidase family protein